MLTDSMGFERDYNGVTVIADAFTDDRPDELLWLLLDNNNDESGGTNVYLRREDVIALRDYLTKWIDATEPTDG